MLEPRLQRAVAWICLLLGSGSPAAALISGTPDRPTSAQGRELTLALPGGGRVALWEERRFEP
jgi:hypothetical protein